MVKIADNQILFAATIDGTPWRVMIPWAVAGQALGVEVDRGDVVIDFALTRRAEIREVVRRRSRTFSDAEKQITLKPGDLAKEAGG
jgi:hypothetical protein